MALNIRNPEVEQATGADAAIIRRIAREHHRNQGSFARLRQHRPEWTRPVREVAGVVAVRAR